jgi:hypothetical protein
MRRLIAWGVSGIISDRPDVAVDVIASLEGQRSKGRGQEEIASQNGQ